MFNHPFHLVSFSPWPLVCSLSLFNLVMGMLKILYFKEYNLFIISMFLLLMVLIQWWRDVSRESFQGNHTYFVILGIRMGMFLFIISELMFFVSFFWAFFHSVLSPSIEIGCIWPPYGIEILNPYDIPMLNTILLLSSGVTVTWSHWSLLLGNYYEGFISLMLTVVLGLVFTLIQLIEYFEASFTIADSIYGSLFFVMTGFHGLHVLIGSVFLLVCLYRMLNMYMNNKIHVVYEMAIWYWHFVDVVWLFLYLLVYWWIY